MPSSVAVAVDRSYVRCALGDDLPELAAAVRQGQPRGLTPADDPQWASPQLGRIPDFDGRRELGRKGTRTFDRATGLAVAATERLIEAAGTATMAGAEVGLVLGTTQGSIATTLEFSGQGLVGPKPYLVEAGRFPNTVMNFAAGQAAIRQRLTGPNATVIAGRVTGVTALRYACRMLAGGQADAVVAGAIEELSPARDWLEHRSSRLQPGQPVAEGCALTLLRRAADCPGAAPIIVRAVAFRLAAVGDEQAGFEAMVRPWSAELAAAAEPVVLAPGDADPAGVERRAWSRLFGSGRPLDWLDVRTVLGDLGAACVPFQTAVALTELAQAAPAASARHALVSAIDPTGYMGAVWFERLAPRSPAAPRG
ncbi:MAG: hypothetical protein LBH76_03260 [Propionibacteriaceae bacterium]|jgi:3-oxoacyl-[acyl-carrier-protein] synthase II|nr:hypothetical protein [Propionibacteriaceae bacterium]